VRITDAANVEVPISRAVPSAGGSVTMRAAGTGASFSPR